jgi:hypothetical protein
MHYNVIIAIAERIMNGRFDVFIANMRKLALVFTIGRRHASDNSYSSRGYSTRGSLENDFVCTVRITLCNIFRPASMQTSPPSMGSHQILSNVPAKGVNSIKLPYRHKYLLSQVAW